jgi:hypothetical protein
MTPDPVGQGPLSGLVRAASVCTSFGINQPDIRRHVQLSRLL